jgi:hypothetical protein
LQFSDSHSALAICNLKSKNLQFQGLSCVPIGVHGPQRATRFSARQPPRTTPSRVITASAYRLHVGVNRHRKPARDATGESVR